MRLSFRDYLATVLVAGIAVPYLGYLVFGTMPFILDARAMAGTGLVLGATACLAGARRGAPLTAGFWLLTVLAVGTLAVGVDALITQDRTMLAVFMGGIVVVWALSMLRHAFTTLVPDLPADQQLVRSH